MLWSGLDFSMISRKGQYPPYRSVLGMNLQVPVNVQRSMSSTAGSLADLPRSQMYEKSFMHRDDVTHVAVAGHDFIITASADGDLRFWKLVPVRFQPMKKNRQLCSSTKPPTCKTNFTCQSYYHTRCRRTAYS